MGQQTGRRQAPPLTELFNRFAFAAVQAGYNTPECRARLFVRLVPGVSRDDYLIRLPTEAQLRTALARIAAMEASDNRSRY